MNYFIYTLIYENLKFLQYFLQLFYNISKHGHISLCNASNVIKQILLCDNNLCNTVLTFGVKIVFSAKIIFSAKVKCNKLFIAVSTGSSCGFS